MRLHVHLQRYIRIRVLAKMMLEQGQRYDQRHDALMILADHFLNFLLVLGTDGLFQIAAQMLQNVGVGAPGSAFFSARPSAR